MRQDQRPDEDTRLRTEDFAAADRDEETMAPDDMDTAMADREEAPLTDGEFSRADRDDTVNADRESRPAADREAAMAGREDTPLTGREDIADRDTSLTEREDIADRDDTPMAEDGESPPRPTTDEDPPLELFQSGAVERFRAEWMEIQAGFVDDPRDALRNADHLVAEVMQSLATTFNEHKHKLEGQWQQGSEGQTEDLRLALRRYRSFFNQLLNA